MESIATISFEDLEEHDEGLLIVRAGASVIGLGLSLRRNRDLEVFFDRATCAQVINALQKALDRFNSNRAEQ